MTKYKSRGFRVFIHALLLLFLCTAFLLTADEKAVLQWNAADHISPDSGISLIKFSSSGLGAYPYAYSTPGIGMNVTIDGVPVRSLSPFGSDLEHIPSQLTSHIQYNGFSKINISTINVADDEMELLTDTAFLMGVRHRFNYDMIFNRSLSETSGIIIGGSSSGIHGGDDTEKNSLRAYYMKYSRTLNNGSAVNFSLRSFRDRDGLINLDNISNLNGHKSGTHMGERRTDNLTLSLGVENYPLRENTSVTPIVYYQSANSRFDRNGSRSSLDERSAGVNVHISKKSGANVFGLHLLNDTRFFDSRLHDDSWTRNESELAVSFNRGNDRYRLQIESGLMNSSEYGSGGKFESELALLIDSEHEFILRGTSADRFPDTGQEYYTSLVYSDTTRVSNLDKFNISQIETGVRLKKEFYNLGIFAFGSYSKLPMLEVSPQLYNRVTSAVPAINTTHMRMSSREKSFGYRASIDTQFQKRYVFDAAFNFSHRPGDNNAVFYPTAELNSDIRISGDFINNVMKSTAFVNAGILRWENSDITPDGNYFLIDCGLMINVSSLRLFYTIENVLNEDIEWFNSMGWLGRNTMWGGKWIFYN
ncbi:hypothetical protein ACFL6K_05760 [Candidatus Latescibacterota bacterium]